MTRSKITPNTKVHVTPDARVRIVQLGSRGHSKTLNAVMAYHAAKKVGKTCLIVAKTDSERLHLVVNHGIDPHDIILRAQADKAGKAINDTLYKRI